MPTICIDPGHCTGYNKSADVPRFAEGDFTWKLAKLLRSELEARKFTVYLTKTSPAPDPSVWDRGQMADGADLMISLHANAVGNKTTKRVVVIPPFIDRNGTYALANDLGKYVSDVMGIDQPYQIYTRTYCDINGKTVDYYGVIRSTVTTSCKRALILEHGFYTCPDVARWLLVDDNLRKLAVREADIIAQHVVDVKEPEVKAQYKVGDQYTVRTDDYYSNGIRVSKWVQGKTFTVSKVLPGKILLAEINSWVILK